MLTYNFSIAMRILALRDVFVQIQKQKESLEYGRNGINPLNAELNPICRLLALLGAHHILHVSRLRVNDLTL